MSVTTYLDRLLEPITELFTPEVARKFVDLRADPELQAHVDELARKANEGTITTAEDEEYKALIDAADIVAIIQSKARQYLAEHGFNIRGTYRLQQDAAENAWSHPGDAAYDNYDAERKDE